MIDGSRPGAFERALLGKLLEGDDPRLAVLRAQVAGVHLTREQDLDGLYLELDVAENMPVLPGEPKLRIDDVGIEIEGIEHGAGCILWVARGRLFALEVVPFAEPWPGEVRSFQLRYLADRRIVQQLG